MDLVEAGVHRKLELQELEEIRNETYENAAICKEKNKALYDQQISRKTFVIDQKILPYQSNLMLCVLPGLAPL